MGFGSRLCRLLHLLFIVHPNGSICLYVWSKRKKQPTPFLTRNSMLSSKEEEIKSDTNASEIRVYVGSVWSVPFCLPSCCLTEMKETKE